MNVARFLYDVASATGKTFYGALDSGCTTTVLKDTALPFQPGSLIDGVAWILSGTYSGNIRRIVAHAAGQITLETALLGAPAAGVTYAVCGPKYTIDRLYQALNAQLISLGEKTYWAEGIDDLVTEADRGTYALPTTPVLVRNLVGLWVAQYSTAPYEWQENFHWREQIDDAGTPSLQFLEGFYPQESGLPMKVAYNKELTPYAIGGTDELEPGINAERFKWEVVARLMTLEFATAGKPAGDDPLTDLINEAKDQAMKAPDHQIYRILKPLMLPGW